MAVIIEFTVTSILFSFSFIRIIYIIKNTEKQIIVPFETDKIIPTIQQKPTKSENILLDLFVFLLYIDIK